MLSAAAGWRRHLGIPDAFDRPGVHLSLRPVPPVEARGPAADGWIGIVRLGESTLVSVAAADRWLVEAARAAPAAEDLTRLDRAVAVFGGPTEVVGPAVLAFRDPQRPPCAPQAPPPSRVRVIGADAAEVLAMRMRCEVSEVDDVGIADADVALSAVSVTDAAGGDEVVAVCGWETWGAALAHLCVLTRPDVRRAGHGRSAAEHALARLESTGLVPQWRAMEDNLGSRSLAARLGFAETGRQLTLRYARSPG